MPATAPVPFPLRRGLNLGGWLSQAKLTTEHVENYIGQADLNRIAEWGFDHVRLPLDWHFVMGGDEPGPPRSDAVRILRTFHDRATQAGLRYILDLHEAPCHTFENRDNPLWADGTAVDQLAAFWEFLLPTLPDTSDIAIDLLNEPTTRDVHLWAGMVEQMVGRVREHAPQAWIVVEGADRGAPGLWSEMTVPDSRCVLGVHFYEPIAFTHQQAFWSEVLPYSSGSQTYPGWMTPSATPVPSEFQHCFDREWHREELRNLLLPAAERARELGVPIHCGEFGAFVLAPAESRYAWLADVLSIFDELGIGWSYWSYRDMGFGVLYDNPADRFSRLPEYTAGVDPRLLQTLTSGFAPHRVEAP